MLIVRRYRTTREDMTWHPSTFTISIPDLVFGLDMELDSMPRAGDSSDVEIGYTSAVPESEIPELKDNEGTVVQILGPPLTPVNDVDTEEEQELMDTSEGTKGELKV
jgi:hypothetical protein